MLIDIGLRVSENTQERREVMELKKNTLYESGENLKRNWLFPISSMAFFCLSASLTIGSLLGLLIAFVLSLMIFSQIPSAWDFIKRSCTSLHIVSVLTAIGICWCGQSSFYSHWTSSSRMEVLENMLPFYIDIPSCLSIIVSVAALFFVYFCVLIFWKEMARIITETGLFSEIKSREFIIYAVLLLASLVFVTVAFSKTEAFYGTESYDIIYNSDSSLLVKGNCYLVLTHGQNDLRQPLFAVFAAPFVGIPYLFSKIFNASASVQAMLMNYIQICMLFTANYMLTKMMKLSPVKRICFMLLTCCTYTQLLFTLMMEQYIVAYFWLIFCMYLICEKGQPDRIALWGAGGTLLTSMILLPYMSEYLPLKNLKKWLSDMVRYGLEFVVMMLVFCRFDVIFNLPREVSALSVFTGLTGSKVTMTDKITKYTEFIYSYFAAPDARGANLVDSVHASWQLKNVADINLLGVVLILAVIISVVLNRNKKSSLLAAGWIGFSIIMFLGVGWGIKAGLILYELYFGWPFLVLLFQLIEWIESKLNTKFLIPVFSSGCVVILAVINVPAIKEMVDFAVTYHPV